MSIAKEQLRQIIAENDINNVGDIHSFKGHLEDEDMVEINTGCNP